MSETHTQDSPIGKRRMASLADVDNMPPALRQCVHEYGYAIVVTCAKHGITDPSHIREFVKEIWAGARQPGQSKNSQNSSGSSVLGTLDWILMQSGAEISALTLVRILWDASMVILPREPTGPMIEASKKTIAGGGIMVTKTEKHKQRLRAANLAGAKRLWPHLFDPYL